jgi:hypothetical protein
LADTVRDERPDTALVPIPLGHDERAQAAGEGVDFEMGRRPLDLVEQTQDVGLGEPAQTFRQRPFVPPGVRQGDQKLVEGSILAEIEELVLAAEVVIQIRGRQVRGNGDVAHARGGEASGAEHARRRFQDAHAPGVGPA